MAGRKVPAGGEKYASLIREARQAAGLNQQRLADALGVSRVTVAGWETGHSRPDLDCLPALCRELGISLNHFFGVREGLTTAEKHLVAVFRGLGEEDQRVLMWQVDAVAAGRKAQRESMEGQKLSVWQADAAAAGNMAQRETAKTGIPGAMPVASRNSAQRMENLRGHVVSLYRSDLPAAAGTGFTLDEERGEQLWLRQDAMTARADEVIPVNGHSMEPTFLDGDEVLVEHTDSLREGEIGVFIADGEGFIKEYRRDGLYSHNSDYAPMRFEDGNDVRCIGRVLGKVTEEMRLTKEETEWMEEMGV